MLNSGGDELDNIEAARDKSWARGAMEDSMFRCLVHSFVARDPFVPRYSNERKRSEGTGKCITEGLNACDERVGKSCIGYADTEESEMR